jgi:hypothetical protein
MIGRRVTRRRCPGLSADRLILPQDDLASQPGTLSRASMSPDPINHVEQ